VTVEVKLHSQIPAVGFYARCGYKGTGVEFIEDGRPHRAMRILIQTLEEDPQAELLG